MRKNKTISIGGTGYPVNRKVYVSPSEYLNPPKRRHVRIEVVPSSKKTDYKVPKTPKTSGIGWGP